MYLLIIGILIGLVIGVWLGYFIFKTENVGTLKIDQSTGDNETYMFLELSKGVGDISKKQIVNLKIRVDK